MPLKSHRNERIIYKSPFDLRQRRPSVINVNMTMYCNPSKFDFVVLVKTFLLFLQHVKWKDFFTER